MTAAGLEGLVLMWDLDGGTHWSEIEPSESCEI